MEESKEELKSLLKKVKEEGEKAGLKLNIQKTKIMASSPITSWQIDGEIMETVRDFILGGSKITADGDCSHEIKILAAWKKCCDQPRQHIKKQRRYFANQGPSNQSYGFSSSHVWMWELDGPTAQKAEHRRIDAFELWCWRRLLRVPWTARSNQSTLKGISPEYSLKNWCWSWNSNTLATWWEELTHWKRPAVGKDRRQEEKGTTENEMVRWHHRLDGHEFEQALGVGDGQGSLVCCRESNTTEPPNWTEWKVNNSWKMKRKLKRNTLQNVLFTLNLA